MLMCQSRRETADLKAFNPESAQTGVACSYAAFVLSVLLQPLRVNGVKVYTENVDKRQVIMDLQIRYAANLSHSHSL